MDEKEDKKANVKQERKTVWIFFLITILMVNPPVLTWANEWVKQMPLLFGWPTLWLYLTFWYVVMWGGLVYFAISFKSWQVDFLEEHAADIDEEGSEQ